MPRPRRLSWALLALALTSACKKQEGPTQAPAPKASPKIGLVTDVGGRGDHSFNDAALRGLELWAGGKKPSRAGYTEASPEELAASLPADLKERQPPIAPVGVTPLVLQSKAQEDYEPNLQTLVDQGTALTVGVGYMLENAVETVAKQNPGSNFLLIDSAILDASGKPYSLPNVRTVVFKEEEGSFLAGALAGLATRTGKVAFVGGMEIPLIQRFEAGFSAGVKSTRPDVCPAPSGCPATYTGSFDNVAAGKQLAQDLLAKGVDVLFHAAGSDGLGVIQAVKEARAAGKEVFVIGVDSDQAHLAPDAVLTSMLKRLDLAIYEAARDVVAGEFKPGHVSLGLAQGGVGLAPVRLEFPGKEGALEKIEALRERIIRGELAVPTSRSQLSAFKAAP